MHVAWKTKFLSFFALLALALPQVAVAGDSKIDLSGELRFRPEMRGNVNFGNTSSNYTGQRVRLNVGAQIEDNIKALLVIQDSRTWGASNTLASNQAGNLSVASTTTTTAGTTTCTIAALSTATACTNTNPTSATTSTTTGEALDLYQANVAISNLGGMPLELKVGRQILAYGDQRLLGHLGWTDNARSFDAYKLSYKTEGGGQIDLFTAKVIEKTTTADDDLFGLYTMWKLGEKTSLDVYYLIWEANVTAAGRSVSTYGARYAGKSDAIDYTAELAMQGGNWGTGVTQSANALAVVVGYTMESGTRLSVEYDKGSGDDDLTDTSHKTFVFPFHTNHAHYGYMDYFSWSNMADIKLAAKGKPMDGPTVVEVAYHMFSLDQANDKWYTVAGDGSSSLLSGATGGSKTAGSEIDITVIYPYSKSTKFTAGYSTFAGGSAVSDRSATAKKDSTWGFAMMEVAF